jgi:hypothetical protein
MRIVAEYLEKAAEFDELARSTSEPAFKKRCADVAECANQPGIASAAHRLVPELTRGANIKLNERVSLRRHPGSLSLPGPDDFPKSGSVPSRQAIIFRLATLFFALNAGTVHIPEKVERDVFAESEVTDQNRPFPSAEDAAPSARSYSLVRAVYLAAIGVATIGWLWLIAWIAMQLV